MRVQETRLVVEVVLGRKRQAPILDKPGVHPGAATPELCDLRQELKVSEDQSNDLHSLARTFLQSRPGIVT